jgi:DNA-binding SARP family transcriptional activator
VPRRERLRADFVEAARTLAELLIDEAPSEAAAVCTAALAVDAYHDPLWRMLVAARERSGDVAAASSARVGYARMLTELGISPTQLV